MEERIPDIGGSSISGYHLHPPPKDHYPNPLFDSNTQPITFQSKQGDELSTYVVHFPKDQIYRVPHPKNAEIFERYRNSLAAGNKRSVCTRVLWIIMILVIIGVIMVITLAILKKVFSPKPIVFSILNMHVTNKSRIEYNIFLKASNPNEKVTASVARSDGGALLFFKTRILATGDFPKLQQKRSNSNIIHLNLVGSKVVPKEIRQSINGKKINHQISLNLKMKFHTDMNLGFLNLQSNDIDMDCKFKVNTLRGTGTRILSQNCVVN